MLIPSLVQPECGQMYGYLTNESKSEALILARERLTELMEKKISVGLVNDSHTWV